MNIIEVYKRFPTQDSCLKHLELVRWNNKPACPYCKSTSNTAMPNESRYHCNKCNTSFKVTVGTIFHNTKLDLQKWFLAVSIVLNAKKGISARQLARDIDVNKNTAWYMLMRIRQSMTDNGDLFKGIIEVDETYIGGKNKNKHSDKKVKNTQGRNTETKIPIFGVLERNGNIRAQKVNNVRGKTLKTIINQNVTPGSYICSDEWGAYNGLNAKFKHLVVEHNKGEYVNGIASTNTIEGFWSLFKRGVIGQYHKLSGKYLNFYIDEFCFRYSNRKNVNIFDLTIQKAVGI